MDRHVNLLYVHNDNVGHFAWIKNLSRLVSSQINRHHGQKYFCDRCLHYFSSNEKWAAHTVDSDINLDPINYKEAMLTKDKRLWQKAIEDELNSMNKNEVWELVSRPTITSDGKKANIIDSRLTEAALKMGLQNSELEPCMFTWRNEDKYLILLLYVDDILVASNDKDKLEEVKTGLSKEFEMTVLGEPKEFLGIAIRRDRQNKIIELTQEKYIRKILARFNFSEAHAQKTPMVTTQVANRERKLRETDIDDDILLTTENKENVPYREAVGSLLYLADCKNSLTTCGFAITLYGDAIIWRTHNQSYVALSTCQAEYVALINFD
ncbi:uncharacterized protein LOC112461349 [Temnothorax curvispinosus]|uniref:Uncharacterized protein LOC112461349 n=1 Tax=Temnothorax curvispinosus TaxID=300111 RepID=A0A6J1QP60_9HYME|nr:uncharacterized protein LOC112461349 [Temnothorax curvispinosus]